ncbi:MAG: hypothetical protein ACMG6E_02875 [Candidatus Roizmanbacteria bacterium]
MSYILFLLFFILTSPVCASTSVDSTVTTQGSSNVHVETSVQSNTSNTSSSTTHKKTVVTVNGETQTIENDNPGTDTIEVKSEGGKTEVKKSSSEKAAPTKGTQKTSIDILSGSNLPTPRPTEYQKNMVSHPMVTYIFSALQEFFRKLFG